jgi:5,10-methylene-tetrahydrofolate dehydrogenase/methenyl tetrahydrofolate cyclohydrolase
MEELREKVVDFARNNKKAVMAVGGLALLASLKLYFRGGICKADTRLDGKVVVVTGGSSGIGKETVEVLATKGCTVIFGARDVKRSEEIVKRVVENNAGAQIFFFPLDLADKRSIQDFVTQIK